MLVLSRYLYESITVSGPCKITVVGIDANRVRIGIEADKSVHIARDNVKNPLPRGLPCDTVSEK